MEKAPSLCLQQAMVALTSTPVQLTVLPPASIPSLRARLIREEDQQTMMKSVHPRW